MAQLLPCSSCSRHIRANESRCPFCSAAVTPRSVAQVEIPKRLSRAGVFLFASTMAVTGCGSSSSETTSPPGDSATDAKSDGLVEDTGLPMPAYGAPIDTSTIDTAPEDTRVDSNVGDAGADSADVRDTSGAALYGAAPFH